MTTNITNMAIHRDLCPSCAIISCFPRLESLEFHDGEFFPAFGSRARSKKLWKIFGSKVSLLLGAPFTSDYFPSLKILGIPRPLPPDFIENFNLPYLTHLLIHNCKPDYITGDQREVALFLSQALCSCPSLLEIYIDRCVSSLRKTKEDLEEDAHRFVRSLERQDRPWKLVFDNHWHSSFSPEQDPATMSASYSEDFIKFDGREMRILNDAIGSDGVRTGCLF